METVKFAGGVRRIYEAGGVQALSDYRSKLLYPESVYAVKSPVSSDMKLLGAFKVKAGAGKTWKLEVVTYNQKASASRTVKGFSQQDFYFSTRREVKKALRSRLVAIETRKGGKK